MRLAEALAAAALALAPAAARGADASVVLRWKPVDGAVAYELEIGADPELRQPLVRERVTTPGYRWRELPEDRRWWRVRGVDALGRAGHWSEVKPLEAVLRAPELRRPADGAAAPAGTEVELACAPGRLFAGYELELAEDPGFGGVVERREAQVPRFLVALRAGAYHWRVRGRSVDGRTTRWSPARLLRVTAALAVAAVPAAAPAPEAAPAAPAPAAEQAPDAPAPGAVHRPDAVAAPAAVAARDAAPEAHAAGVAATSGEATAAPGDAVALAPAAPGEAASATIASAAPGLRGGRFRAGARLGWHTNFGAISSLSPGVEADWLVPGWADRLAVSVRVTYFGASARIPPLPGPAAPATASAHVLPLGAALVYRFPRRIADLYAGAGPQLQLVHSAVAGEERLEAVPGAMLLAGAGRRLRSGELFLEAGWATGTLDGDVVRVRTGGLTLALGFRGGP